MSLLLYFKASSDTTKFPDPRGPLSTTVPSSSIESANAQVKRVIKTVESESFDAARGGVSLVLWTEKFLERPSARLDHESFEDCLSAKIGPRKNFSLYGMYSCTIVKHVVVVLC